MSFSIEAFKKNGTAKGSIKPSSYECAIFGGTFTGNMHEFRIEALSLPGAAFASIDNYKPYGTGLVYTIPYSYNPQEITLTFTLDEEGEIIQNINDWINKIVDIKGDNLFYPAYYEEYAIGTIEIYVFKPDGTLSKTYKLNDCFPIAVDQMQMSWATTDDLARLNVTFRYLNYTIF
jgi:hypothetical protein